MCSIVHHQAAFAPRRKALREWFGRLANLAHRWRQRRRAHRELCDYLASDHRAAADIGITSGEARRLPFWRP